MSVHVFSVAGKMPEWVDNVCADYNKRLGNDYRIQWTDLALEQRGKNQSIAQIKQRETQRLVEAVPAGSCVVALDERGRSFNSQQFSRQLENWLQHYKHVSFLIGGPDGLDFELETSGGKKAGNSKKVKGTWADVKWSLSELTFPHPMVRVILAEQIYRAWSLKSGHPYHRQ